MNPLLTVIICTYNRADLLDRCLKSLMVQEADTPFFEIIVVVDHRYSNFMIQTVRKFQTIREILVIIEKEGGLSNARNAGYSVANGELLVYLDDDAMVPPDYIHQVLSVWDQFAPDIMGGPVYPYYTDEKPGWFRDSYETKCYEKNSGFSKTCRITGANFIIRKDILKNVGLFDKNLGMKGDTLGLGEEAKVLDTYRLQTPVAEQKVFYSLEVFVYHHVPKNKMCISYFLNRKYSGGILRAQLMALDGQLSPFSLIKYCVLTLIKVTYDLIFEIIKNGPTKADYINCLGKFCLVVGALIEGLRILGKKPQSQHK